MAHFTNRESFIANGLTHVRTAELDSGTCYICLDTYQSADIGPAGEESDSDTPVRLPCSHVLGKRCILRWTRESNTCPYCRAILYHRPGHRPATVGFATLVSSTTQASIRAVSDERDEVFIEAIAEPDWVGTWYELMGLEPTYPRLQGTNDLLHPFRAPPPARVAAPTLSRANARRSIAASTCRVCGLRHREDGCILASIRQPLPTSRAPRRTKTVKGVLAATSRVLASIIPSSITNFFSSTPAVRNTQPEVENTVPDDDMDDLVESHNQWMDELEGETESEYYDDQDYF
jgi:hypothetical protein